MINVTASKLLHGYIIIIVITILLIGSDALKTIYQSILSQHIALGGFVNQIQKSVDKLVSGAIQLHSKVSTTFLPTAIKFHYIFNLRDLSNIFQVRFSSLSRLK